VEVGVLGGGGAAAAAAAIIALISQSKLVVMHNGNYIVEFKATFQKYFISTSLTAIVWQAQGSIPSNDRFFKTFFFSFFRWILKAHNCLFTSQN
jgi:hypothetical protein